MSVSQLLHDGNRYDRRLVSVEGKVNLVKARKSRCGDYTYFVLEDRSGVWIHVTDYTDQLAPQRGRWIRIAGYYQAHLHHVEVCLDSRQGGGFR